MDAAEIPGVVRDVHSPVMDGREAAKLRATVGGRERVLCCHRAVYSGRFPANSLAAVQECVEAGVPRFEIDVRFLRDDSMLIFHDSRLDDETTGSGPVDALDRAEASRLRHRGAGSHGLCFLEDVAEAAKRGASTVQVDLKLMRPMSGARLAALTAALAPIRELALIGSQAHWNLRPLATAGFRVALDPTLHWHYRPGRDPSLTPGRMGVHGLWDDAPLAHIRHASARDYVRSRVDDLGALLPAAVEWMVDIDTIEHVATLGTNLGDALRERGIELAAWTLRDRGPETLPILARMFDLGAATVIADDLDVVAGAMASLADQGRV